MTESDGYIGVYPPNKDVSLKMLDIRYANHNRGIDYCVEHRKRGGSLTLLPQERNSFAKGFNALMREFIKLEEAKSKNKHYRGGMQAL